MKNVILMDSLAKIGFLHTEDKISESFSKAYGCDPDNTYSDYFEVTVTRNFEDREWKLVFTQEDHIIYATSRIDAQWVYVLDKMFSDRNKHYFALLNE